MRIVGGAFRGTRLAALGAGDDAARLRPTPDRVREALFNVLLGGRYDDPITGAQVLDLFAGTGALGLEALSRGAADAVFVEKGARSQRLIADNIERTRTSATTRLIRRDATRLKPASGPPASLVFLDPPYGTDLGSRAIESALTGGWLAPGALILWEDRAPHPAPPGLSSRESRRYGDTHISFLEVDR